MRFQPKFPDKQISRPAAETQLVMMLCGCTDSRLASYSVDSLAAINRTPAPRIAILLAEERARRG